MDINSDALQAALKLAGQDTANLDKTLRLIKALNAIRTEGTTPDAMMALLAQYNPKYAALSALLKAMTPAPQPPKGPDDVQYNHF